MGSNQGKLPTGQGAVGPEPGLAQENGCLAGPRHLHDGPQPERVRGTVEFSGNRRCHSFFQGWQGPEDWPLKNKTPKCISLEGAEGPRIHL